MGDRYRKTQMQGTDKIDKERKRQIKKEACRHGDIEMDTEAERQSRNAKGDKRNRNGKGETEQRKIRKMEVR